MEYLVALLAAIAFWGIAHAAYQRKISMIWRRDNGELRDRVRGLEERLKEADHEIHRIMENNREARRARRQYQGAGRPVRDPFVDEPVEDAEEYLLVPDNLVNFFHRMFEKFREEDSIVDEKKETARKRKLNISADEEETDAQPEMEERDE